MTISKIEEAQKARRTKVEQAIALALKNQWADAVEANKAILEAAPEDVEALNRLGKALLELGRYAEAREALEKVLKLAPTNVIARKNLDRVTKANGDRGPASTPSPQDKKVNVSLDMFMTETGKSGVTPLVELGSPGTIRLLVGGEPVLLAHEGSRLVVRNRHNQYIGRVPPRLAQRLVSLMDGGNKYAAAVLQIGDGEVWVIIRETFQHPDLIGKTSFPAPKPDRFRSYVRGRSLVYYDLEEPSIEALGELGEDEEVLGETPTGSGRALESTGEDEEEPE